ncbi:MAG: hypothetical protein D6680_02520 [Cyanobacteria bacterium J007]|nr:MAG: hypothetical protein D6680_02520 [Cyanobacteria bacterium J007]
MEEHRGLWGKETACQVDLSGFNNLDKWRGPAIPNRVSVAVRSTVGKPALYPQGQRREDVTAKHPTSTLLK